MRGAILEVQALPKVRCSFRSGRSRADAALLLGMLGVCAAPGAQAQSGPPGDGAISVQKRPRPDLDPVPVRFGTIEVLPTASMRVAYDDNVYATRTDKVEDALVTLSTGVAARSTWSRHAVSLDADAALARGLSQDNEDIETYDMQAGARLDLGPQTAASFNAGYSRAYEPRGSVGDTALRGPRIAYNRRTGRSTPAQTPAAPLPEAEGTLVVPLRPVPQHRRGHRGARHAGFSRAIAAGLQVCAPVTPSAPASPPSSKAATTRPATRTRPPRSTAVPTAIPCAAASSSA